MKKGSTLLILSIFFLALSINYVSSAIYINEIEVNPIGNDSGYEWIELYNDGPPINLNNWYLQNKDGDNYSLSGNVIDKIFVLGLLSGLDNTLQNIKLYDNNGILKDSYFSFNDTQNDIRTWSRMPDGFGNFVFQDATKGILNQPLEISDKNSSPSCITSGVNVTLTVDVLGICVEQVIFSINIDGDWINFTGVHASGNEYRTSIPSNVLPISENIQWKVFAKDCFNSTFQDGLEDFYVNSKTILEISPLVPDGLQSWYISKPFFTLINDDALEIKYQWDSDDIFTYSGEFGLENTPNNGNVTGGILELNYWSDVCGGEAHHRKVIKTDFSDPIIKNLVPEENSVIINNPRPLISALLDELYQSNSGIDKHNTTMFIDGSMVNPEIKDMGSQDAEISYQPNHDLSEGIHDVRIDTFDKSGRTTSRTWTFNITLNVSIEFDVYAPIDKLYNTKRIPFNISSSEFLEKIEYINYNEKTPKWKILCSDCKDFGFEKKKEKTLLEGENNITIRGVSQYGQNSERNILLLIESKHPKILKTFPLKGFSNGIFWIEFEEDNPSNVSLFYGNSETGNKHKEFNLENCININKKTICEEHINLEDYNNQEIEYYFSITDIANNTATSRPRALLVDTISPIINEFSMDIDNRRVLFNILVEEKNFKKASYIDYNEITSRFRTICSKLNLDNSCTKRISFPIGSHNLTINIEDKAGNFISIDNIIFDTF